LRGQTEQCLLAVRGKPAIRLGAHSTLLTADAGELSAKPGLFYRLVDELWPGSKVDLFSRQARPGWQVYGDEVKQPEPLKVAS
jgi:N6-adenosine-specific RNA methylase IME4